MRKVLDWLMVGGAIVGSLMLAANTDWSKFGFLFFTVSSVSGVYVALRHKVSSMVIMQGFFTITNVIGVVRWFM